MKKVVYFIGSGDLYTRQGAAVERMKLYAKALIEAGHKVVLGSYDLGEELAIYEDKKSNLLFLGKHHGRSRLKGWSKILYQYYYFSQLIEFTKRSGEKPIFIIYPDTLSLSLFAIICLRLMNKYTILCEKNERNIGIILNFTSPSSIIKKIALYILMPFYLFKATLADYTCAFYNGIIAISTHIEKWAKKINNKVQRIPILSDEETISTSSKEMSNASIFRIGFAGTITPKKEGLLEFLQGLALSAYADNNVQVDVYGLGNEYEFNALFNCVRELKLDKVVNILQSVPKGYLASELCKYDLLILTRPRNVQTMYGFSTKLSEYMMAGVPPLVTNVSDNTKYVKDGYNGFVLESLNEHQIATKLNSIYRMKGSLHEIGSHARETAINHFDYRKHANTLSEFISSFD